MCNRKGNMKELTDEQLSFLKAEGKVVVTACPGSGKTYSVASKLWNYLDNWDFYHQGIAVLSFTNVASEEIYKKALSMNKKIAKLTYPHFIGTVDSFIDEFIVLRYGYLITKDKVRPLIALNDNWKLPYCYWRGECHKKKCTEAIEKFHWGIDNNFYKDKEIVKCKPTGKSKFLPCQSYKKMLADKNIIFQNEVTYYAYKILKEYPMIAKAITERFPIIIVDEAQDMSNEQMAVFDLLAETGIKSIFMVGDPDQAIYEWRNASPECFEKKMDSKIWKCINLTKNFRNSQNICNATSWFSATLNGNKVIEAVGEYKDESQKPVLLLTENNTELEITDYFLKKCKSMGIKIEPDKVAVLSRGRIHSGTDVKDLWKSKEIELMARAAYEWENGSRKIACKIISEVSFKMIIGEEVADYLMEEKIEKYTTQNNWKNFVIDVICEMPNVNLGVDDWVKACKKTYIKILEKYGFQLINGIDIENVFKIKTRDNNNPNFKVLPLKDFFEKKINTDYTRSSIHGVKGETYDAVLIYIKSIKGNTLTPKFLSEGDLNKELMRIAYVGMTRPRRLLMIAMPNDEDVNLYSRFPAELWDYEKINDSIN